MRVTPEGWSLKPVAVFCVHRESPQSPHENRRGKPHALLHCTHHQIPYKHFYAGRADKWASPLQPSWHEFPPLSTLDEVLFNFIQPSRAWFLVQEGEARLHSGLQNMSHQPWECFITGDPPQINHHLRGSIRGTVKLQSGQMPQSFIA